MPSDTNSSLLSDTVEDRPLPVSGGVVVSGESLPPPQAVNASTVVSASANCVNFIMYPSRLFHSLSLFSKLLVGITARLKDLASDASVL